MNKRISKVLVFRCGSIGDFVIALPCFHFIRNHFRDAEITLLTNIPARDGIASAQSVLAGSGLVDRYLEYPGGTRSIFQLRDLRSELHSLGFDVLIYLAPSRGILTNYRDLLFFQSCGIRRAFGLVGMHQHKTGKLAKTNGDLQQAEAARLGDRLKNLGSVDISRTENWDLHLSAAECDEARRILADVFPAVRSDETIRVLALSIGTKQPINEWGDARWHTVLLGLRRLDFGLVLLGGMADQLRSDKLAKDSRAQVPSLIYAVGFRHE